jgi:8-oxo-dGTP diphosphatase
MYCYQYPRAALTVDAIVIAGKRGDQYLLLIERGKEPFLGNWALPGGFIDMTETLEQACLRELKEETGLILPGMKQFRVFDAVDRDPRHRTLSTVYYAFISERLTVAGSDDAVRADWFPLRKLPPLAFDHEYIITAFLSERL